MTEPGKPQPAFEPPAGDEPTTLSEALALAGIELPPDQATLVDAYRHELWGWNERMNLTRHTTFEKFVTRDLVDTLELAKLLARGARVLDLGSGGGVPGLRVAVCDSVAKKAAALEAIVDVLGLPITCHAARAQEVLEVTTFDTVVARAVAPLRKILTWLAPHWDAFDELLLIKGRAWVDERGEARHVGLLKGLELRKAAEYVTPRTDATSVVLRIWRGDHEPTA